MEVQWGWIAALLVLLAGSLIFVLTAMISSAGFGHRQRPGPWKSSNLPLLKAIDAEVQQNGLDGMRSLSAMENWARGIPVQLSRGVDGNSWKLTQRWGEAGKPEDQQS